MLAQAAKSAQRQRIVNGKALLLPWTKRRIDQRH